MERSEVPVIGEESLAAAIRVVDAATVLSVLRAPWRPWSGLTFHHSYAPHLPRRGTDYARLFNRFHWRHRGWELGLGYHLLFGWDPEDPEYLVCWASYRWVFQQDGAHARNLRGLRDARGRMIVPNAETVGVCFVGDLSAHRLPVQVYRGAAALLAPLARRIATQGPCRLYRHDQFQDKDCPGRLFEIRAFLELPGAVLGGDGE